MALQRKSLFNNNNQSQKEVSLDDLGDRFPVRGSGEDSEPDKLRLKKFSEEHGFPSREPTQQRTKSSRVKARRKLPQTGRNEQFNIRVHPTAKIRFYDIADENSWGLGETFEHALEALEEKLISKTKS